MGLNVIGKMLRIKNLVNKLSLNVSQCFVFVLNTVTMKGKCNYFQDNAIFVTKKQNVPQ